jgi:hypothetical protein
VPVVSQFKVYETPARKTSPPAGFNNVIWDDAEEYAINIIAKQRRKFFIEKN